MAEHGSQRATDSGTQFRTIFENVLDGIVVADAKTKRLRMVNPAFCRMSGYTLREATELTVADIHPPDSLPRVLEQFGRQVTQEQSLARDIPVRRKDGTVFYADVNAFPITFSGAACLMGLFRDVTERRQTEERLRESEEKYRTLVENAGETIAMVDEDGVFLFLNVTAAACLGGKPNDYVGKTMWDLFPQPIADRQVGSVRRVIQTGHGMKVVVLTQLRGQARWYDMTLEPIRDAAGEVTAALVVGRDIHELRQARQELEEHRDRMARAEQLASLGTLSATIAHELTQPLTVSRLSLQEALAELRESGLSKAVMEALEESLDGIADAAARVAQFRNFARKSSHELPSNVRLHEVITRTMRLLKGRARECDMALIVRGLEDLPEILAHEKNMEQMCFALVENAIQAASHHRGRRLTVTGGTSGSHVHLRFEDDCGGIRREHLDKVFQPFFTTKSPREGTGLGLCIVDRVVTQARGKVRVENHPGKGVAFCITLPANVH